MKKIIVLLMPLIIILNSCGDNGTGPDKTEQPKDPRGMTWTADTLAYPESIQTLMSNILAFNSKDIYIYGHNFITRGKVYHFDGNKWEVFPLVDYIGGYNVLKMIAFGRNNIWGVGDRGSQTGLIFNYNGTTWVEKNDYAKFNAPLYSIDGENANEFYACGRDGIVWYYKNGNWLLDTVKIKLPPNTPHKLHSLSISKGVVYIFGSALNDNIALDKHYFIKGNYKSWTIVDSMNFYDNNQQEKWGWGGIIKGENGKLYSKGSQGFYEWTGTEWKNFHQSIYKWGFYVFNDKYFLALGTGGVEYYNGENWIDLSLTVLKNYKDITFRAAWTDGKELFLVANMWNSSPETTIVLHGK